MMRNGRRSAALAAAAMLAANLSGSSDSQACEASWPNGHYYAILSKLDAASAENGAQVSIYTTSLSAANSSNFVDHEMWYYVDSSYKYWVEMGFKDGATCRSESSATDPASDCSSTAPVNQAYFWADSRNGGGYNEHYPSFGWSLNNWYAVAVEWAGYSCAWNVYAGGVYMGTSSGNCGGSQRGMQAGIESTDVDTNQHIGGYLTDWQRLDSSNHWVAGWDGATLFASCPADIELYDSSSYTEEVLHGPL